MDKYLEDLVNHIMRKDPSINVKEEVYLLSGYNAMKAYLKAHKLYKKKEYLKAREISEDAKRKTGIEIHPGARIGKNFFIDHGVGVVIGETTVIGNNVTIYHGVTLGAKRIEKGDRHPKIGDNVIIGCNATVLGNIKIVSNTIIGAGAIVTKDILEPCTLFGQEANCKGRK